MKKKLSFLLLFFSSVGAFILLLYGLVILQIPQILQLDMSINTLMTNLHYSDPLNNVFIALSQSFDPPIFLTWFLLLLALLWFRNKRFEVLFLFFGVAGGQVVKTIIKYIVERPRPENPFELSAHASSFPSGHATTAVFFFLAILFLFTLDLPKKWKMIVHPLLFLGMIGVPFSRVFVQVHYFSDIIGGALIGIASLAFTLFVFSFLKFK